MRSKLARSLPLEMRGDVLPTRTPLLVPSFSSKAVPDVRTLFTALQPSITESFLISAYDVYYHNMEIPSGAPAEVLFFDSGGYEVSRDHDQVDPVYRIPEPKCWTHDRFEKVIGQLTTVMPCFVTAFDHPEIRQPLSSQLDSALEFFRDFPQFGREILIKPEKAGERLLNLPATLAQVHRFNEFDVIGVTEVELGDSVMDRMENIARLRLAMDLREVNRPLHVFGSLDPVSTPLYFLSGADIFDGLSWLRLAYSNDLAIYHRNRIPLEFGPAERESRGLMRSYEQNLYYLAFTLTARLKKYLIDGDEGRLGTHGDFFQSALDNLRVRLPKEAI